MRDEYTEVQGGSLVENRESEEKRQGTKETKGIRGVLVGIPLMGSMLWMLLCGGCQTFGRGGGLLVPGTLGSQSTELKDINGRLYDHFAYTSDRLSLTEEWLEKLIRLHRPRRVYVDSGGLGLGLSQDLAMKYGGVVRGINFGERPDDIENYANKRGEMFDRVRCYFAGGPISLCATEGLVEEMQAVTVDPEKPKLTICRKDDIRKVIGRSTNYLDALALTFAEDTQVGGYGTSDLPDVVFLAPPLNCPFTIFTSCLSTLFGFHLIHSRE